MQLLGTPGFDLEHVGHILHWIFLMVPHYSLASGIFDTFKLYSYNSLCNTYYETCRQRYPNYTKEQCWDLSSSVKSVCKGVYYLLLFFKISITLYLNYVFLSKVNVIINSHNLDIGLK